MSIRSKVIFFLIAVFLFAILNVGLVLYLENRSQAHLKSLSHTKNILISIERLISYMKDTETGQRGFLLTQQDEYLEPYYSGFKNANQEFLYLKAQHPEKGEHFKKLLQIELLMELKFYELNLTIQKIKKNDLKGAYAIVKQNDGKYYMDDIRELVFELIEDEKRLLKSAEEKFIDIKSKIYFFIVSEVGVLIVLLLLSIFYFDKIIFSPLKLLLHSTQMIEKGGELNFHDVVSKDEMGTLLSSFYNMNKSIVEKTNELNYQANHDPLTGLYNRKVFNEVFEQEFNRAKRAKSSFSFMMIDIDYFKFYNDTYGHHEGDRALQEVAKVLERMLVRSSDFCFRLGGEEFGCIFTNLSLEESIRFAQKINSEIEELHIAHKKNNASKYLTISAGLLHLESVETSADMDRVYENADKALYRAKNEGRNRVILFS